MAEEKKTGAQGKDSAEKKETASRAGGTGKAKAKKATAAPPKKSTPKKSTAKKASAKNTAKKKAPAAEKKQPEAGGVEEKAAAVEEKTAPVKKAVKPEGKPPAAKAFRFEERNGIGILTLDLPGQSLNILNQSVMEELDQQLEALKEKIQLRALIFMSGKPDSFIAGADVNAIKGITHKADGEAAAREGHRIFNKFSALPFPTIVLINGVCLGGGLELALACSYRLAVGSPKTKIGLPEVKIGIFPGWGGTQRLPRLIGIQKALDYILTGRTVEARKAYRDGIIDRVIPAEFPPERMRQAALDFAEEVQTPSNREKISKRRKRSNLQALLLEKNPLGRRILFDQARKKTFASTKGHYPSPLKALQAVEKGMETTLHEGLALEAKLLGEVIVSDVCKQLINVFWMTEELKKDKGVAGYKGPEKRFERIGVLGAGAMGGGIAQLMAQYNHPVRMKDINLAAVARGMEQASKVFSGAVKRRRMKPEEMRRKMGLISGSVDYTGFDKVDLVIEAIVEDLNIKKKVFAELDENTPEHAVLASNTSSLPVTEMAAATKRPENVAGMHFFNPVHRMPLVEIIRAEQSSDETIVSLVQFSRAVGKTPIVVKDSPGFLVNRILAPYMNEAAYFLEEGQTIEAVDKALVAFGMPMGPLDLYDEVGIDVAHKVAGILQAAFGDRMPASEVVAKVYEAGRYGKKTGKGFYAHQGKNKRPDPGVYDLLGALRQAGPGPDAKEMQERCVYLMINEAARCLEEEVVRQPRDVDIGMIFGTGFPPFRGGLLHHADTVGIENVVDGLLAFSDKYGARFEPAESLKEMARKGKKFFE